VQAAAVVAAVAQAPAQHADSLLRQRHRQPVLVRKVQSIFACIWFAAFLFGALNHTLLPRLSDGRSVAFSIPGFQFGFVMFNRPMTAYYFHEYKSAAQREWRTVAELEPTYSFFYQPSRSFVNHYYFPEYIENTCRHGLKKLRAALLYFRTTIVLQNGNSENKIEWKCESGLENVAREQILHEIAVALRQ